MSGDPVIFSPDRIRALLMAAGAPQPWNEDYIDRSADRFCFHPDDFLETSFKSNEDKAEDAAKEFLRACANWLKDMERRENILQDQFRYTLEVGLTSHNGNILATLRRQKAEIASVVASVRRLRFHNNFKPPKKWHLYASMLISFYCDVTSTTGHSADGPCVRFTRLALAAAGMRAGLPSHAAIAQAARRDRNLQAILAEPASDRIAWQAVSDAIADQQCDALKHRRT